MSRPANDFLLAVSYFTRLPIAHHVEYSEAALNRATSWFPLVGWLVATVTAGVLLLADQLMPTDLAILLSMMAGIIFTGGFHEDGLADTADGFGPVGDRERSLEVMKDSRLGTFGALGLVFILGGKFLALSHMPDAITAAIALMVAHPLSRLTVVVIVASQPYLSRAASRARSVAAQLPKTGWLLALPAGLLPALLLVSPLNIMAVLLGCAITTAVFMRFWKARFGGYTGDILGANQQIVEFTILLILAALTVGY